MEATLIRGETDAFLLGRYDGFMGERQVVCTTEIQGTCNGMDHISTHIEGFSDWTPNEALAIADAEGIMLGERHWPVINFMREYYSQHRSCPMLKLILKKVNQMPGGRALDVRTMFSLFGATPVRTAARYAGLPEPDSCI